MRNRAPSGTPPERALQRRALRAGARVRVAPAPAAGATGVTEPLTASGAVTVFFVGSIQNDGIQLSRGVQ